MVCGTLRILPVISNYFRVCIEQSYYIVMKLLNIRIASIENRRHFHVINMIKDLYIVLKLVIRILHISVIIPLISVTILKVIKNQNVLCESFNINYYFYYYIEIFFFRVLFLT